MILLARLLYRVFKLPEKTLKTCDQHFDVYFDKIWYKKLSLLYVYDGTEACTHEKFIKNKAIWCILEYI